MRNPTPSPPRWLLAVYLLCACALAGCVRAQAPTERPPLVHAALDAKLRGMLRYDVPLMSVDSLARGPKPLLLDVRAADEFAVSHLPGAVRVEPGADLPAWLDTVARDRPVVAYCSVGYRSERYGRQLRGAGFTQVHNLYGSLFEWVDRGHLVVDSLGAPTQNVHTYNRRWSQWLTSGSARKVW